MTDNDSNVIENERVLNEYERALKDRFGEEFVTQVAYAPDGVSIYGISVDGVGYSATFNRTP